MAQVTVEVGGRSYRLTCDEGQQEHVFSLSRRLDALMPKVKSSKAPANEARNILMAALLLADELHAAETERSLAATRGGNATEESAEMERAIAQMLNRASDQIELVTRELEDFG